MSKVQLLLNLPTFKSASQQNGLPLLESTNQSIQGAVTILPFKPVSHSGVQLSVIGIMVVEKIERGIFYEYRQVISPADRVVQQKTVSFDVKLDLPYSTGKSRELEVVYALKIELLGVKKCQEQQFFEFRKHVSQKFQNIKYKTEVGADNAIQIEIEAFSQQIDLRNECFTGTVHFVLCQRKFEEMTVEIRRRTLISPNASSSQPKVLIGSQLLMDTNEAVQTYPQNTLTNAEHAVQLQIEPVPVLKYQAMEGAALRGEVVPFKVPLWCCKDVFPSFENEGTGVQWSALIDVSDTEGRHYYKEVPLNFYLGSNE